MALDTDYFLEQVKLKGSIPGGRFTDHEILGVSFSVLLSQLVPMIIALKEEYYVQAESQNITANVAAYPIPHRALGLSLREVKKIVSSSIIDMDRISPEDIESTQTGTPVAFYLEAQDVVLYPTPNATQDTLKLSYFKTPSKPVTVAECAVITAINTGSGLVTATPPTTWTASSVLDFISRQNGHKCLGTDITPSSITSTTITFATADLPATLAIGDYVALATEAPFIQVPDVCFDLCVRLTVNELLDSMGDQAGLQSGLTATAILKQNVQSLLMTRVQGAIKKSTITLI